MKTQSLKKIEKISLKKMLTHSTLWYRWRNLVRYFNLVLKVRMYLWNHQFSKIQPKNLLDSCPGRFYRLSTCDLFWIYSRRLYSGECITSLVWITFQGRNLSNFFGNIMENWWFHKYILLHLTFILDKKNVWNHCPWGYGDFAHFIED